jgi:hypothetical protein
MFQVGNKRKNGGVIRQKSCFRSNEVPLDQLLLSELEEIVKISQ